MEQLSRRLRGLSAGRVLDAATGRGEFVELLVGNLGSFREIVAIDSSERAAAAFEGRIRRPDVCFMTMDVERMTFPDGAFDTVCISNSLHHMSHLAQALRELMRVLKPGGLLIVNEMICDGQTEAQLSHVLMHHWSARIDTLLGTTHHETFTRRQIINMIHSLGLQELEIMEYTLPQEDGPEIRDSLISAIDRNAARLGDQPGAEGLREEGERIRERIRRIGLSAATEMLILGRKPQ